MERDARPLPAKAHAAMVDAAKEEIHQGMERNGLMVLLCLFTGMRKRLLRHFTDNWLQETTNGYEIHLPKSTECTISNGEGCDYCNKPKSRGQDGFLKPKTSQGEQRTIPIQETWYDTYHEEKKEVKLKEYLDHYFTHNNTFQTNQQGAGVSRSYINDVVSKIAKRRQETIKANHQGVVERSMHHERRTVPDVMVHDLRASWCAQCLRMGVDETTLMDWGGWANADMINHYRSYIGDPTGSELSKLEGEDVEDSMTAIEKLERLKQIGLIDEDEQLSADDLAEFDAILS